MAKKDLNQRAKSIVDRATGGGKGKSPMRLYLENFFAENQYNIEIKPLSIVRKSQPES